MRILTPHPSADLPDLKENVIQISKLYYNVYYTKSVREKNTDKTNYFIINRFDEERENLILLLHEILTQHGSFLNR